MTIWDPKLTGQGLPLYQSLAQAIEAAIEQGELRPGERLPTQRELAGRLGIALATVTRGYSEAERRGLVSGEVGRGTFVSGREPEATEDDTADLRSNSLLPYPMLPELQTRIGRLLTAAPAVSLFEYGPHAGQPRHRESAARWFTKEIGLKTSADQMLITGGAQHAMAVVFSTILDPGDTLLVEEVTYSGMKSLANLLSVRLEPVAMDGEGILPDALREACRGNRVRALYCMSTFQNPTSAVMSDQRRCEIAEVAGQCGLPVVEDDSYGFLYPDRTPIAAHYPNTYYLTATSKSLLPALRIGFVRAPSGMVDRLAAAVAGTVYFASTMNAEVVSEFLDDGTARRVIDWKRVEMEARQAVAREALPPDLYFSNGASPHGWLTLPEPWVVRDFVSHAAMRGVQVMPADYFAVGRDAPHAVRLCLGPVPRRDRLAGAVATLAELLEESPDAGRVVA